MTTFARALANSTAAARPMPEPPPVIQATLPSSILLRAEEHLRLLLAEARCLASTIGQHLDGLLHCRALGDAITPALHVRVVVDVYSLPFRRAQPGHRRHVRNRVLVAGEPLALRKLPVENTVEPVRLVLVAVHRVLDPLRRVAEKVMRLAEHRPDMAHLRHYPLHDLPALAKRSEENTSER